MSTSNSKDDVVPESRLSPEMIAYRRLEDLGIRSSSSEGQGEGVEAGEASYRWFVEYDAMVDAVKLVLKRGSRFPEDI